MTMIRKPYAWVERENEAPSETEVALWYEADEKVTIKNANVVQEPGGDFLITWDYEAQAQASQKRQDIYREVHREMMARVEQEAQYKAMYARALGVAERDPNASMIQRDDAALLKSKAKIKPEPVKSEADMLREILAKNGIPDPTRDRRQTDHTPKGLFIVAPITGRMGWVG